MANRSWCPHCSSPNLYEVERPKFCSKCGKDMSTAFQTSPVSQPAGTPQKVVIASTPDPITLRRPRPLYGQESQGDDRVRDADDYYSTSAMQARASQLASHFGGAFNISLNDPGTTVKAGSIAAFREVSTRLEKVERGEPSAKKTRARKTK